MKQDDSFFLNFGGNSFGGSDCVKWIPLAIMNLVLVSDINIFL